MSGTPFPTHDVVSAVMAHMNGDHADDCVVIAKVLGERPAATAARMTGMDADAIELTAEGPTGEEALRIPFSTRLTERSQVRAEVARMYHESAATLGLPSREH